MSSDDADETGKGNVESEQDDAQPGECDIFCSKSPASNSLLLNQWTIIGWQPSCGK
jgi:hypothetical protein